VQLTLQGDVDAQLDQVQPWDGSPLPSALRTRLKRAWQQGGFLTAHIQTLEAERRALEITDDGEAKTEFLRPGDRVRIEATDPDGRSLFGAMDQSVVSVPAA